MAQNTVTFNPQVTVFNLGSATSTAANASESVMSLTGVASGTGITSSQSVAPQSNVSASAPTSNSAQPGFGFTFGAASTASAAPGSALGVTAALASTTQSSNQGQGAVGTTENRDSKQPTMTYRQLQESLNKFMKDIQEEETRFYEQALKVNVWDRTLVSNGERIINLNSAVEKIVRDHSQLENTLVTLKSQEVEMQNLLVAIESGLQPGATSFDPTRAEIYRTADSLGQDLIEISNDLKLVIEHVNERNKPSSRYRNNKLVQIMKIVNEHSDILLWIEKHCNKLTNELNEAQKGHQTAKNKHVDALRQLGR